MSTGEDDPSPGLNGRLRPRKSTTTAPNPQIKSIRKTESRIAQNRPKRTSTPSKASPIKQDDLATKSDSSPTPLFHCPYCDRKFITRQTASKHARRIHLSTSKQDNFIKCIYCNHSDAESYAIIKHMVDCHPNQYFACLDCHTRFPSTAELAEHKLNVCERQKPTYRSKLRQKTLPRTKTNSKRSNTDAKSDSQNENTRYTDEHGFNGIVISCELKPSELHDAADIEDKITTNFILPPSKTLANTGIEKNAVIVLDDLQWNKRMPPNFSFHNTDADQILSRLGVVHRSPRVGESRKDLIRMMDEPNEKFEKCFDTSFYSKVAKNVQENLAKYLDGSFNFNPDRETIKTRKSKASVVINTAEGFPILLAYEQFSRHLLDGLMPRTLAPKHKWKWDTNDSDNKNAVVLLDHTKRDSHINNCIVTLVSSLDIWTQLRMRRKFEEIFKTTPTPKKTEKQNIISMELKEILESRDIPTRSSHLVKYQGKSVAVREGSELPAYLGLSPKRPTCEMNPAVLSGEWVRPRAYVCCACGEQTRDARTLSTHISTQHPNAQVQHYEIVGETLLSADILKHLYVPPSQMSNRTRPPRGFRDCTKCKKSITLEDLHQHMLDCAGDTPTVRRKCRYRPFGVRRRRHRLPDNAIRKKIRKDIRSRHRQKVHMRPRPRIRTEVGDAETIRKMIADLPAKRNRISPSNILKPRRNILKAKKAVKLRASEDKKSNKIRTTKKFCKIKKSQITKKQNDTDHSSAVDEDDQPLKMSAKRASTRMISNGKEPSTSRGSIKKTKKKNQYSKKDTDMEGFPNFHKLSSEIRPSLLNPNMYHLMGPQLALFPNITQDNLSQSIALAPPELHPSILSPFDAQYAYQQIAIAREYNNQQLIQQAERNRAIERAGLDDVAIESQNSTLLTLEQPCQIIDIHGAGPSNAKQHGGNDDYSMRNGKDRPGGKEDDGSQNNNIVPTSNTPFKHSIASLTSDTEVRDSAIVYQRSNFTPTQIGITIPRHVPSDNRLEFENEAVGNTLDKPPIPIDSEISTELITPPSRCDSVKCRESGGQPPLPNDLIASPEPGEQPPLPNDPIESAVPGSHLQNMDAKTDADKSKLNRSRKGLNDCIAMLKTKKGLRLDCVSGKCDDESQDSTSTVDTEILNSKYLDTEVVDLEQSIIASTFESNSARLSEENNTYLTPKLSSQTSDNCRPVRVFSRSSLPEQTLIRSTSETRPQRKSTESLILGLQTDHHYLPQKQVSGDNPFLPPSSIQNETKRHSSHMSTSRAEYEVLRQMPVHSQSECTPWVEAPPRQPPVVDALKTSPILRRNSFEGLSIPGDNESLHMDNRMPHTFNPVFNMNDLNPSTTTTASRAKYMGCSEEEINMDLYRQHISSEMHNQGNTATLTRPTFSPNSRKARRKPVKTNLVPEPNLAFNYRRTTPRAHHATQLSTNEKNHTEVSTDSNKNLRPNSENSNIQLTMPEASSSINEIPLTTPSSPKFRQEQYKRCLDLTKTGAGNDRNKDRNDISQNTKIPISPENTINGQILRRHSVELVTAQSNERIMTQTYHDIVNMQMKSEDLIKRPPRENVRYEGSEDMESCNSSVSTIASSQDGHKVMQVNREVECMDNVVAPMRRPVQDFHNTLIESEQRRLRSQIINENENSTRSSTESQVDYSLIRSGHIENTYTNQDCTSSIHTSNALDNNELRYEIQSPEEYYRRSSSYQNCSNINPLGVTEYAVVYDVNRHDTSLHAYHKSFNASFPIPVVPYSSNIYSTIPLMSALHCGSDIDEAPLDLSCDPKVRRENTLESRIQFSHVFKKPNDVPVTNELASEESNEIVNLSNKVEIFTSCVDKSSEKLNLPLAVSQEETAELSHVSKNRADTNLGSGSAASVRENLNEDIYVQQHESSDLTLNDVAPFDEISEHSQIDLESNQINSHTTVLMASDTLSADGNETSNKIKDSISQPLDCNYIHTTQQQSSSSNVTVNRQETESEYSFIQNKKIARAASSQDSERVSESNFENKTYNTTNSPVTNATDAVDLNIKNIEEHNNKICHVRPLEISNKKTNEMSDQSNQTPSTSIEAVGHIYSPVAHEIDNISPDQDAETVKKIAMIPKEIIDIINRIPEDTRNKLINVLPQYVTTPIPVSTAANDMINPPRSIEKHKNNVEPQQEKKQHATCIDSTRLSVNTTISPRSIIPKKRHSPSQSGGLNYNEPQPTTSVARPPDTPSMSRSSLKVHESNLLNKCNENNDNSSIDTLSVMRRKSLYKNSDDTEINVVDYSDPESINKSNDMSLPAGNDFLSMNTSQDLALKVSKTKICNEQTASLRAVRIRTSAVRKSFSDEKRTSSSYQANGSRNEKLAHQGQINNTTIYNCRNLTGLKYDTKIREDADNDSAMHVSKGQNVIKDIEQKFQDQSINIGFSSTLNKIYNDTMRDTRDELPTEINPLSNKYAINFEEMISQVPTKQIALLEGSQEVQDENKTVGSNSTHMNKDITEGIKKISPVFSAISKDKNTCTHKTRQNSDQSVEIVNLGPTIALQTTNIEQNRVLVPTKSVNISGDSAQNDVHKLHENLSNNNETKKELFHAISPQSRNIIENDNTTELKSLFNLEVKGSGNEMHIEKEVMLSRSPVIENTKAGTLVPSKYEGINEDDSEDDICLAVIKQKHRSEPLITETVSSSPQITTESVFDAKLVNKETSKRGKYQTKKKLRKSELSESNKLPACVNDTSGINFNINNKKVIDDKHDITAVSVNIVDTNSDRVKSNSKIDVNKESNKSENFNKIKDYESDFLPEQIELLPDKILNKDIGINNECRDRCNTNLDLHMSHLKSEENVMSSIEPMKVIKASADTNALEVNEKYSLDKGRHFKGKNKTDTSLECLDVKQYNKESDTERVNSNVDASDKCSLSVLNKTEVLNSITCSKTGDLVGNEIQEVCLKGSKTTTILEEDNFKSDFRLCSEIRDINTLPLRRSRRGKSMYIDSSIIDDSEHTLYVEDVDQKTPLTMKRLILSRVEKDKKRINEDLIRENESDTPEDLNSKDKSDEILKNLSVKKTKTMKRKKSPTSRQKIKKTKPITKHQYEDESSDVNSIENASENSIAILRELSNAENKIEYRETHKNDVQTHATAVSCINFTEKLTLKDKILDGEGKDGSVNSEVQETNVSGKRKLNITKITDLVSPKSKKIKYHINNASSDFDSDDEKGLLETKRRLEIEKGLIEKDCTINISQKHLEKEENISNKSHENCDEINLDLAKKAANANTINETRITCYSRPISTRRQRSSSATLKTDLNYDPYDIDFEDMVEPAEPITKSRRVFESSHTTKFQQNIKQNKNGDFKMSNDAPTFKYDNDNITNINNDSDSDSSKSDVPLQKYVEDKISKNNLRDSEIRNKICFDGSANSVQDKTNDDNLMETPCNDTVLEKIYNLCESETLNIDQNSNTNNNISLDQSTQKQKNKQKKPRRTLAAYNNVDSVCVSNEVDQQLRSDKFMENFGFYSERIPRKSNLLASKKITETFHMISNESDDSYFAYKDKSPRKSTQNENKKKSETGSDLNTSQDSRTITTDATNGIVQSTVSKIDIIENNTANSPHDVKGANDTKADSSVTQNILEGSEVRTLENDSISGHIQTADGNAAQNNFVDYQYTSSMEMIAPAPGVQVSILQSVESGKKQDDCPESFKKPNKTKLLRPAGYKEKMYPDVEEIDMFEDKFDKIKRKRRSQAVAAKQVQNAVETNNSVKSRKQSEKKRSIKSTKKNINQSTLVQVPTKGALKGFDGFKISIPTQDLNMPPHVSPPRHQKKGKKVTTKRRKETSDSESSCYESDEKDKLVMERDIYEFKDSEDTELLELRPSTVMDRFRSMHNKNKSKNKEKVKCDTEKEKQREKIKDKERKTEMTEKDEKYQELPNDKRQKKYISREEKRCIEKVSQKGLCYVQERLNAKEKYGKTEEDMNVSSMLESSDKYTDIGNSRDKKSPASETRHHNDEHNKEDNDSAVASTSGYVPDRVDESDYESELSSPEGEFIFYLSDDINCVCPSDNDSDDSDVERGCGRPNCIYKIRNADKNAAIGNIFKNNAMRCEKPETKEPEEPRPDMDQLFDSLFETKPTSTKSNGELPTNEDKVTEDETERGFASDLSTKVEHERTSRKSKVSLSHQNLQIAPRTEDGPFISKEDHSSYVKEKDSLAIRQDPISKSSKPRTKNRTESKMEKGSYASSAKWDSKSSEPKNSNMPDTSLMQIFAIDDKRNDKRVYSHVSENGSQIRSDVNEIVYKNLPSPKDPRNKVVTLKAATNRPATNYNTQNKFNMETSESVNKQCNIMYSKLPAEKISTCAQTEKINDGSESDNESAATKYLRGLSPSEAAQLEMYTMVSAQGTQTVTSKGHSTIRHCDSSTSKSDDEMDMGVVPKSRIRLQKYDIREIAQKSKSTKSIQTEKSKSSKCSKYNDDLADSDHDDAIIKCSDSALKEPGSKEVLSSSSSQEVDSFATPTSRLPEKHSPRKSDEGISTSHDYSADAFDHALFDDTGVARQRARRKCTVGKQNILAEHWSSESEFDGVPPRPNSADSVVASAGRKKKGRKKEGHHSGGRRGNRHASKNESKISMRGLGVEIGGLSEDSDACAPAPGPSRAPPGPKMRARPAHHYWSSDGEDAAGPQPQHGWIVGDSHKKLVTMLAHAKGRKRATVDKRHYCD